MNPLTFLLAVLRAIRAIVVNLFSSPPAADEAARAADAAAQRADAAARWRRRQHQAYRRSRRERRKACRHGRQTRCSARSRRRRTERPLVRRPFVPERLVVEVRRTADRSEWEVVRYGNKSRLRTARSALAAEQRGVELLEERGGGILFVADSIGKIVFGLQVIPGERWPLGSEFLPKRGDAIPERVLRRKPANWPRHPQRAPRAGALPVGYELRKGRGLDEWVLVRLDSGTQMLAAQGKQRMIGRFTALLRGTGGGSVRVLDDAGEAESIVEVQPAGPPLGGYTVSETPVKPADPANQDKAAQFVS